MNDTVSRLDLSRRPTVQTVVDGRDGRKLTVRITRRGVFVREYRKRKGETFVPWQTLFERQLLADLEAERRAKRTGTVRVRRGLLR